MRLRSNDEKYILSNSLTEAYVMATAKKFFGNEIQRLIESDCSGQTNSLSLMIMTIRECQDYDSILRCAVDLKPVPKHMRIVAQHAMRGPHTEQKLCFRALTLYIFTNDLCERLSDEDVKKNIRRVVRETIAEYDVDWTVLLDGITTWDIAKFFIFKMIIVSMRIYTIALTM